MKYLHLMSNEKFISPYIQFIENKFEVKNHLFYIIGGLDYIDVPDKPFVKYYNKKIKNSLLRKLYIVLAYIKLYPEIIKSEKIILHGLFNPLTIVFLFLNPWTLKKCNWVMWGGDLYSYRKRKANTLLKKFYYKIEDFVKGNIGQISYLAQGDYDLAREYYDVKGIPKRGIYINPVNLESLKKYENQLKDSKILNIQIGNSADPENNHFEILDMLKKYEKEDIKIFAPLSYGNKEYALKVKSYGEKIFGEKFIVMLDFFEPEKYAEYLSDIDILVFNHKRQQGLGNIFSLAYLEKKIYMRSDISSWNYLLKDLNLSIYDINDIKHESFQIFKQNKILGNKEKILETVYSEKYIKQIWEENFKG
ncbi:MAG: TDP-N-acetylfucosamine:lipid II N-acetylfucosaminyltransferase [Cetobacterium sp.]